MKTENTSISPDEKQLLDEIQYAGSSFNVALMTELVKNVVVELDTALRLCAQYDALDAVKYLVEKGADISAHDYAPVTWATYKGNLTILQYFVLERNLDVCYILNCLDSGQETIKWAKEYKKKVDFNNKMNEELVVNDKKGMKVKI